MTEQTYIKLNDKVKRPVFNANKINADHPKFKKFVDEYVRWFDDFSYEQASRNEYEEDIRECLKQFDLDGYNLCKYLATYSHIDPDSDLVEILDRADSVKRAISEEMINAWIKENFLTIPEEVIGKKINAKQGIRSYNDHYIITIRPETYEIFIDSKPDSRSGYAVGFENVTFL